ncbi:class I adenylate-forming enzyme family protein [Magnetococcus sp. PR-3]|uniref:class I adenylate-forming enzyme family protein n=1 Tax=Magnetococcus sp. PR-3 TaxID=3120355 RepID=UPI002FCDF1CA
MNLLQQLPAADLDPFLHDTQGVLTYGVLKTEARRLAASWKHWCGQRIALRCAEPRLMLPTLVALNHVGAWVFLLSPQANAEKQAQTHACIAWVDGASGQVHDLVKPTLDPQPASTYLTFFTSGSTGVPKAVTHTWQSMTGPVRQQPAFKQTRWLMSYPGWLYAGLQVISQVLLNGAQLVVPARSEPHLIARLMAQKAVTHASGTPTFWRRLLAFGQGGDWGQSVEQITLGGEAADQSVLDGLREQVGPQTRITHIFATSEHGRCFTVHDGLAGFPTHYLDQPTADGVELAVRKDRLWIRAVHGMVRYEGVEAPTEAGWRATGDLVDIQQNRVLFLGREGDLLNVGGHKVWPERVESALRGVEGVVELRVFGHPSKLTGVVPAVEVVTDGEAAEVEQRLRKRAHGQLEPFERPRLVQFVEQLTTKESGKMSRTPSCE